MSHEVEPGAVPLSNRRGTCPFFGLDRISLSFPLAGWERDPTAWSRLSLSNPGTPKAATTLGASLPINDHARVFIGVQEVPATGQTWGKVELNPSRVVDPEGVDLCPPDRLRDCVVEAADVASSLLAPAVPDVGAMKVRRLDVARDFVDVERPAFLVRGLGPVHRPWARRNLVHFDPSKNGAQTLMVGSGAGVVRLYDKDEESGGRAPGVLRWEVEARRTWCEKYGEISTLDDVTDETVARLGHDRWEWSAMATEVQAMEAVVERVMRSELSFAEQRSLIGYLSMIAAGADVRASRTTHAKYRRIARQVGVALDPETLGGGGGFSARLDLDSGRMVCGVS